MGLGGTCLIASFDRFAKLAQLGDLRQASQVTDASAWGLKTGLTGYRCFCLGTSDRRHRLCMAVRPASQMLQLGDLRQVSQVRDASAWGLETGLTG